MFFQFWTFLLFQPFFAPMPTFFGLVTGIRFEMSSFSLRSTVSHFKHLLYHLCSVVKKILTHVIWKSLFLFCSNLKYIPTFLDLFCTLSADLSMAIINNHLISLPFFYSYIATHGPWQFRFNCFAYDVH